ncbi:hypothetical protein, partial [Staphylococcus aureus]|uniref:hypothetical protein n=1 Tax=Staphylococcus aureus TaxID=1280 RepID=UPI0038B28A51
MSRTRKSGTTPTHASSQANSKLSSPEEEQKPLPASSQEATADNMAEVKPDNETVLSAQSSIPCKDVDEFVPMINKSP